jgi:hypothetical protein
MATDIALQDSKATYFQAFVKAFQNWDWGSVDAFLPPQNSDHDNDQDFEEVPDNFAVQDYDRPFLYLQDSHQVDRGDFAADFRQQTAVREYVEPDTKYYQVIAK